jgi:hypothetical protein
VELDGFDGWGWWRDSYGEVGVAWKLLGLLVAWTLLRSLAATETHLELFMPLISRSMRF